MDEIYTNLEKHHFEEKVKNSKFWIRYFIGRNIYNYYLLLRIDLKKNIKNDHPEFFSKSQKEGNGFKLYKDGFYANLMKVEEK